MSLNFRNIVKKIISLPKNIQTIPETVWNLGESETFSENEGECSLGQALIVARVTTLRESGRKYANCRQRGNLVNLLCCCHGKFSSFPVVTISLLAISRALLPITLKANKLPLEMEPVALTTTQVERIKPGHQTYFAPYSTDDLSKTHIHWVNLVKFPELTNTKLSRRKTK